MEVSGASDDTGACASSLVFHDAEQSGSILASLNRMRKGGRLTDTTVHAGGRSFPCHRAILACCSSYFLAMFSSGLRESGDGRVHLDCADPVSLELLIDYAYTSVVAIDAANAQALLESARRFQFEKVVAACCEFIGARLDPSNCLGVLALAETHACPELHRSALDHSLERFEEVIREEEFGLLTAGQLAEYLSHDALNVSREEVVYHSLRSWMESNKGVSSAELHRLFRCVRLHYLPPELLQSLADVPEVGQDAKTLRLVQEALRTQKRLQSEGRPQAVDCVGPRLSATKEVMVVVGGYWDDHSCVPVPDVKYLNPVLKKWATLTSLPEPLSGFSVTSLRNRIYIIGGKLKASLSDAVYRYDAETDRWDTMSGLGFPREHHGSAVIGDRIFAAGGEQRGRLVPDVERFSPRLDQWTTVGDLPEPVTGPAVASHGRRLFVVGGQSGRGATYGHIQCFDTAADRWTVIETVAITSRHFPALMLNGYMYILGGCGRHGVQVYDPDADACLPPMAMCSAERHLFAAVALQRQGLIVVAGGMRNYSALSSAEAFVPVRNRWSKVTDMPHALRVHGCGVTIHRYFGPPFY